MLMYLTAIFRVHLAIALIGISLHSNALQDDWFETFKANATDRQLYHFLYALPKGGDLHNHLTGSNFVNWWYELATDETKNGGYRYYTRTAINNCVDYAKTTAQNSSYFLMFRNLQQSSYDTLDKCQQSEYTPLKNVTGKTLAAWKNSLRLNYGEEGRNEFFYSHWQRLNDLGANPYINSEMLYRNMKAFAAEGLMYLETMEGTRFYKKKDGSLFTADEVADIYRARLRQTDAVATGVKVGMQYYLLRFIDNAEQDLEWIYRFVDKNRDLFVGLNMVGAEDIDKGYPLRFLETLRTLRRQIPTLPLSIHAGEQDKPSRNVRDTLLLGASRIGHGINLISDPDTMLLMRNSNNLIEINLISNLMLGYVNDYQQHPFPEYLRFGIPVTLTTDDRGMWDSNMTDEYFVAVKEFNLSWQEIRLLLTNSINHAFIEPKMKLSMQLQLEQRLDKFERSFQAKGLEAFQHVTPVSHQFTCKKYQLCLENSYD